MLIILPRFFVSCVGGVGGGEGGCLQVPLLFVYDAALYKHLFLYIHEYIFELMLYEHHFYFFITVFCFYENSVPKREKNFINALLASDFRVKEKYLSPELEFL
jgi:hypothetical protein